MNKHNIPKEVRERVLGKTLEAVQKGRNTECISGIRILKKML